MKTSFLLSLLVLSLAAATVSGQTPESADELLSKAKAKASEQHKNIFVVFDASW
jgi:hypothetical protein